MTDLKLIKLEGENIRNIKAIKIEPGNDDNVLIISGKNGAGKSTALELIWLAMSVKAIKKDVIRKGEQKGKIILDLNSYIVERVFDRDKGNKLKVTAVNGKDLVKINSPQKLLNTLISDISIDPLGFIRMSEKEQRDLLLDMLRLKFDTTNLSNEKEIHNLDDINNYRKEVFDKRTGINRTVKSLKEQLEPLKDIEKVEIIPISEITAKKDILQETLNEYKITKLNFEDNEEVIKNLKEELIKAEKLKEDYLNKLNKYDPESLENDIKILNVQIEEADLINTNARKYEEKSILSKQYNDALNHSEELSNELKRIDDLKINTIENAKMPVKGLSIDDECVRLNDIAIIDLSSSEQIRLACAIVMAQNPELKVITIEGGSLIDSDGMKIIEDIAKENDYLVLIEVVSEENIGIHIVDGEII